jgi:hypothetical protein
MARMTPRKAVALMIPLLIVAVLALPWVVDTRVHADQVPRNVVLDNRAIGGFGRADLEARVHNLAGYYGETPVEIRVGDETLETTVGELGAEVDEAATVEAALDIEQDPRSWIERLRDDEVAPVVLTMEQRPVIRELEALEGSDRASPIEPLIQHSGFGFAVVPGVAGNGIPADSIIPQVIAGAAAGDEPIVVDTESEEIPPRFTDDEARALAEEANELTGNGITVSADGESAFVEPEELGPWITSRAGENRLRLVIDREQITEDLPGLLPDVGQPPRAASFTVRNNRPFIVPGAPGTGCCAVGSTRRLVEALQNGEDSVELRLTTIRPIRDAAWAESLGIVEEISLPDVEPCYSYAAEGCRRSTHHSCCESRVTNIHRMADIVRGYVIPPNGGHFSINEVVGPRTVENGFVLAGPAQGCDGFGGGGGVGDRPARRVGGWGGLPVRHDDLQRRLLRRARHPQLPVPHRAPQPLPVRSRVHGVLPRARVPHRQQHALRRARLARVHRHQHHGAALLHPVRHGCPDGPDHGHERQLHDRQHDPHPYLRRRPHRDRQLQRLLPQRRSHLLNCPP